MQQWKLDDSGFAVAMSGREESRITGPWQVARSRYLAKLDDEERTVFNEATIENLYYDTSNTDKADKVNSKTRKITNAIQPLVHRIEEYGKAMDAYANIAPNFLAPIWGSL
jgi:hypothetical protein